jgi:hypothetical protein
VCGPGQPHGTPGQAGPMQLANANKLHRKSGGMGHPSLGEGTRGAPFYFVP